MMKSFNIAINKNISEWLMFSDTAWLDIILSSENIIKKVSVVGYSQKYLNFNYLTLKY